MATPAHKIAVNEASVKTNKRFEVRLTRNDEEVEACLRLRYRIFSQEMGARLSTQEKGIDKDRFDEFCKHLMIIDNESGKIIATTRLLISEDARRSGMFYSETEFDLKHITFILVLFNSLSIHIWARFLNGK